MKLGRLKEVNLTLPITAFFLVMSISLIIAGAYLAWPSERAEIAFVVAVLAGSAALYSAYYNGAKARYDTESQKRMKSLELSRSIDEQQLKKVGKLVEEFRTKAPKELYEQIRSADENEKAVDHVLGFGEDISVAIQFGCVNEEMLFKSCRFIIVRSWERFGDYVSEERTRLTDPHLYLQIERLAVRWREDKSLVTGKMLDHT